MSFVKNIFWLLRSLCRIFLAWICFKARHSYTNQSKIWSPLKNSCLLFTSLILFDRSPTVKLDWVTSILLTVFSKIHHNAKPALKHKRLVVLDNVRMIQVFQNIDLYSMLVNQEFCFYLIIEIFGFIWDLWWGTLWDQGLMGAWIWHFKLNSFHCKKL